jgi:hypothetical protein
MRIDLKWLGRIILIGIILELVRKAYTKIETQGRLKGVLPQAIEIQQRVFLFLVSCLFSIPMALIIMNWLTLPIQEQLITNFDSMIWLKTSELAPVLIIGGSYVLVFFVVFNLIRIYVNKMNPIVRRTRNALASTTSWLTKQRRIFRHDPRKG